MSECGELMAKLNAIESKLNSLGDRFIPKADRGKIVDEGGLKGKSLALAAILPLLGAYTLQSDFQAAKSALQGGINRAQGTASDAMGLGQRAYINAETALQAQERLRAEIARFQAAIAALDAEIDVVDGKASNALGTARNASELADLANGRAGTALGRADNALSEAKGVRRLYDELNGRFIAFQNKISGAIDAALRKADDAFSKAVRALGVSDEALAVGKKALGVAFDVLGKIAIIFQIIEGIFLLISTLDLRARVARLESQFRQLESEISKILGILFGIKEQIGSLAARFPGLEALARQALSIANAAARTAQSAQGIANQALAQSVVNAAAIAAQNGVISGLSGRIGQALSRPGVPGPRGPAGPRGERGFQGLRGLMGLPGRPGRDGAPGRDGRNGINGKNGMNGRNGAPGRQEVYRINTTTTNNRTINNTIVQQINPALLAKIDATTTNTNRVVLAHTVLLNGLKNTLGTMQRFAETAWRATRMDKVVNLLTLISVLHNASMLSRDIAETLGYAIDNALQAAGIPIKDEEGNQISVTQVVGGSVTNFIKGILGDDVYNGLRDTYLKANRIIQTGSMVIWTIRSIQDSALDLAEWTAENTGKIGNALKRFGVVGERAYPWMSESAQARNRFRSRFDKATGQLERAENFASSFATGTSNVLEVTQETQELSQNFAEFKKSVTEFADEPWPDNTPVQQTAAATAAAAQSPAIAVADTERP